MMNDALPLNSHLVRVWDEIPFDVNWKDSWDGRMNINKFQWISNAYCYPNTGLRMACGKVNVFLFALR